MPQNWPGNFLVILIFRTSLSNESVYLSHLYNDDKITRSADWVINLPVVHVKTLGDNCVGVFLGHMTHYHESCHTKRNQTICTYLRLITHSVIIIDSLSCHCLCSQTQVWLILK